MYVHRHIYILYHFPFYDTKDVEVNLKLVFTCAHMAPIILSHLT